MRKTVLILGSTGKMGSALSSVLPKKYKVIGKNSNDFNADDFNSVEHLIKRSKPDIVVNAAAFLGIDPCENDPQKAFLVNTLYPKFLAQLSNKIGFILVHFSTDAVFSDRKSGFYTESDRPIPLNIYGFTKFGGDCFIQSIAAKYYIFRIPVLFGISAKNTQFVEKMLQKISTGCRLLTISDDIVTSPTFSLDVAREVLRTIEKQRKFGLYHVANSGRASLFELMREIVKCLKLDCRVVPASYKDFAYVGVKNTCTPIKSTKIPGLRHWKKAVKEYCCKVQIKNK